MKYLHVVLVATAVIVLALAGCKKDDNPAANNPGGGGGNCSFTTDVIAVDGTTRNIIRPFCHTLGNAYFAEFHTDTSAAPTGVAMVFFGSARPAPGSYAIALGVPTAAGTVYVEYYDPSDAWVATTGTVTVAAAGSQVVITFCSLTLTNGTTTKTVSIRGTTNL